MCGRPKSQKGQEAMHARKRASQEAALAASIAMIGRATDFPGHYVLCLFFLFFLLFISSK
jgi:hypothetical protein